MSQKGTRRKPSIDGATVSGSDCIASIVGGGRGRGSASQAVGPAGGKSGNGTKGCDGTSHAGTVAVDQTADLPHLILPSDHSCKCTYRSAIVNLALMKGSIDVDDALSVLMAPKAQPCRSHRHHWNLDSPKIIFHITGTANPKDPSASSHSTGLDPLADFMQLVPGWFFLRMKEFITSVLFDIAVGQDGAAWMFDGGTKCGIMKLVGNLHKEVFSRMFVYPKHFEEEGEGMSQNKKWHSAFPLIGVSELSKIDPSSLKGYDQAVVQQLFEKPQDSRHQFTPDDDHTHHLFMHMNALKCEQSKSHDGPVISRFFLGLSNELKCPVVCCFHFCFLRALNVNLIL
jgi:hypothetical protein